MSRIKEIAQIWDQIAEANKQQKPTEKDMRRLMQLIDKEPDLVELMAGGQPNKNGQKRP